MQHNDTHSTFFAFFPFKSRCEIGPAFSGPAFSTPAFLVLHFPVLHCQSWIFRSCISYPGNLVPYFPVVSVGLWSICPLLILHFLVLRF